MVCFQVRLVFLEAFAAALKLSFPDQPARLPHSKAGSQFYLEPIPWF